MIQAALSFAQVPVSQPWWYILERGKNLYRNGDYGEALLVFENARRERRTMYERMEQDFISLLSVQEVRRLGDSLDWVERYARERSYTSASAALEELYYRIPRESFNNSAAAALRALGGLKDYPEAEYWIGEIYRAEGELNLALNQFQKAWEQRTHFENPGFATELLYKIADIYKTIPVNNPQNEQYSQRAYNEMERTLLLIIESDTLWSNAAGAERHTPGQAIPYDEASASFARRAMTRTLEQDGAIRFLTMYRYNNTEVEEAHRLLGFYYSLSGRYSRAQEHLMFAFLIQNSVIIAELIRHTYDFTFTSLEALIEEIGRRSILSAYAATTEYYKTVYYLASSLYGNGKTAAARDLWAFLASRTEAGEWQNRAAVQLRSPRLERAVEMP
jgi:tetratricopeptide (TPR) repeat protein